MRFGIVHVLWITLDVFHCVCVCLCVCVRACVRACVHVCHASCNCVAISTNVTLMTST